MRRRGEERSGLTEFQSQPELIQGWREKNKMVKTGKHKEREAKMDRGGFLMK